MHPEFELNSITHIFRKFGFALMHPEFELNSITHIFRKFGVSRIAGSDVIFAFIWST